MGNSATPPATLPYPTDPAQVPEEFFDRDRFVGWAWEFRGGKWTKPPVDPHTGRRGNCADPSTWGSFQQAVAAAKRYRLAGIGVQLTPELQIVGIDADKCRDPQSGELAPWARSIVDRLRTFSQISPSSTGLRLFIKGRIPGQRRRAGAVEMYSGGRYLTLTTERVAGTPNRIEERQTALDLWYAELFPPTPSAAPPGASPGPTTATTTSAAAPAPLDADAELIEEILGARYGVALSRLWMGDVSLHGGDHSNADYALCRELRIKLGLDPVAIDALFRQSGLMRSKWDDRRGAQTYGQVTIRRAMTSADSEAADMAALEALAGGNSGQGAGAPHVVTAPPGGTGQTSQAAQPPPSPGKYACTDTGNAERFAAQHGADVRYCRPFKRWYVWDKQRWAEDATGAVEQRAKATVRTIYTEASNCVDPDQRTALGKHAVRSESEAMRAAMVALASSEPGIPVLADDLDADPWLLNVKNGTLDLRTGMRRLHRREDLLSKLAPVEYHPDAPCPKWEAFLERVLPDEGVRRFVQRAAGYSLTGDVSERILLLLFGLGRNGKSVYLETLRAALGDYAMRTPAETLLVKREGGIPNDIARLKGARFVTASETADGRRLAEALVKELTGGDTIPARFMRAEWFDYKPQFKVWLATNHKPVIRGTEPAIWDRIKLVPFTVRIPDTEQDKQLLGKLRGELPGILAWAVRGCLDWQQNGLGEPAAVTTATGAYRASMDVLGDFLDLRCICGPKAEVTAADLWADYDKWCQANGEKPMGQRALGLRLGERGFVAFRGTGGVRTWRGLGLLPTP